MGKRIYPLSCIKYWYCYDIDEICAMYSRCKLSDRTVYKWIKQGLKTTDKHKPLLIYGGDLKKFLGQLNESGKCQTAFNEFFCFGCKEARIPYKKQVKIDSSNPYFGLKAICPKCKSLMNKNYKLSALADLKRNFKVVDVLELYDSKDSSLKTDFLNQENEGLSQPAQGELF